MEPSQLERAASLERNFLPRATGAAVPQILVLPYPVHASEGREATPDMACGIPPVIPRSRSRPIGWAEVGGQPNFKLREPPTTLFVPGRTEPAPTRAQAWM